MTWDSTVSIAVTTRNSEATIYRCLESIRLQTYRSIELIVVDNYSDDATTRIARSFTSAVYLGGPERTAQRNLALLQHSRGAYMAYIDSDMILGPRVVEDAVQLLRQGYAGVYVPEVILAKGYYGKLRRFERSSYVGTAIDAVRFFTRRDFHKLNGFDENLLPGPEDWDLSQRLADCGPFAVISRTQDPTGMDSWPLNGYCYELSSSTPSSNIMYHDESGLNARVHVAKKGYYAPAMEDYRVKWGRQHPSVRKQFSVNYRLIVVFLESRKWRDTLRRWDLWLGVVLLKLATAMVLSLKSIKGSKSWPSSVEKA